MPTIWPFPSKNFAIQKSSKLDILLSIRLNIKNPSEGASYGSITSETRF